ncbi:hypothetical protein [Mycoplasmopsis verecunda]|uniref:Uncharacterized protein n=1 Tax=Mycoplasmopsis verecunda TaxID=171291 RepID=A0A1T4L063_9BACT|nr:hypothetical protein [Mycoplasmopsis verecunda]WPB54408.1 hypothetical protein SAM46_02875 [Mycoplasmopsis verecunda]SJZ48095.1 hypothetical protein SAMN02745154_00267 [Mycoplasmopsis verecunda]
MKNNKLQIIVNLLQNENKFIIHGAYALHLQGLLNRDFNDMDVLISKEYDLYDKNQIIDKFLQHNSNFNVIKRNEFMTFTKYNNEIDVDFMVFKNIPSYMYFYHNNADLLKAKYIYGFKLCQLFSQYIKFKNNKCSADNIYKIIDDLIFLNDELQINNKSLYLIWIQCILINLDFDFCLYRELPYCDISLHKELSEFISSYKENNSFVILFVYLTKEILNAEIMFELSKLHRIFIRFLETFYKHKNNYGLMFYINTLNDVLEQLLFLFNQNINDININKLIKYHNDKFILDFGSIFQPIKDRYLHKEILW